ncbi:MAG TPA: sigma-70 family RNA polymerase sigma factor [Candidatus Elarobacter sp.]|jgi:RNA polymerase sigma-70 factor (ECF subfamily)|nr:sigma-70 family RNA polymerase sigma factor [Candidatus Elarobacter sp.]
MAADIDLGVVERARLGAQDDLEALLVLVWPDAYRLAYAVVGRRDAAEDAAQDACLAACRSIGALRDAAAFRVWFARIVVREASAVARRVRASAPIETVLDSPGTPHDDAQRIDLWRALATLAPALRTVVVLRYFEDLSSREIGAVLGVPAATIRFRLAVALRRLRPLLDDGARTVAPIPEVRSHAC